MNATNNQIQELDRIAKMLVRRDFELSQTHLKQEKQVFELDRITKMMVRRDFELLQTNEAMRLLDEAKAKDEALLSSIGDGMIAVDKDEKVMLFNQYAEKALGWNKQDIVGKKRFSILEMQDEKGKALPLDKHPVKRALLSAKKTNAADYYYVRCDKTKFPVAITVSPVILHGKLIGAIEIFRDITKEKEIDRAKTEFVSLASHQLRSPLTAINWSAEMLLWKDFGRLTKDQEKYLKKIHTHGQRMVELINALLNVSRIDLGTLAFTPKPTDLKAVADSVLDELLPQIEKKKLKVKKIYSGDLPLINIDPKLLRIVFQNLLSNAVKYTPTKGVVSLTIKKRALDVILSVQDTGCGIPKVQQAKIFTKLFRAENAQEMDPDGTGLGLYIVKSIVKQSNGKIWFESIENKGATFYVTLPLKDMKKKQGAKGLI